MKAITLSNQQIHFLFSDFCPPTSMILPGWRVIQRRGHDVVPFGKAVPGTMALTVIMDTEPPRTVLPHLNRLPDIK